MSGWEFAVALLQLGVLLFNTFMSERVKKKEADARNEKYDIDFEKVVQSSMEKWKESRKKRSKDARDMDKRMDEDKP